MRKTFPGVAVLLSLILTLQGCVLKQDREIGYYFVPQSSLLTLPDIARYFQQIAYAKQYGMQFLESTFAWNDVEYARRTYGPYYAQIADAALSTYSIKGILALNPVNISMLNLPKDIEGLGFDDPEVIDRYKGVLDFVLARTPNVNWAGISIGNEVDTYLGSDQTRWQQYICFIQQATAYVHLRYPGVPVGVKSTLKGLIGANSAQLQSLNAFTDVIYVTYFPDLSELANPNALKLNVQALLARYPNRRVEFLEIGFPSATAIGGSEQLQAQFIDQLFDVWDTYVAQIKRMNFVLLYELTPSQLDGVAPILGGNPIARAYWGSVGLHNSQCARKPAFNQLQAHLFFRLWNVPDVRQASRDCSSPG